MDFFVIFASYSIPIIIFLVFIGILYHSFKPNKEDKKNKINITINLNFNKENG